MICVSVCYPNAPGAKFDWDYYINKHVAGVRQNAPAGMVRIEVDKGIGTGQPGVPAPFVAMAHMYFNNMDDLMKAMASAGEGMADIPNFTNIQPQVQISEIVA